MKKGSFFVVVMLVGVMLMGAVAFPSTVNAADPPSYIGETKRDSKFSVTIPAGEDSKIVILDFYNTDRWMVRNTTGLRDSSLLLPGEYAKGTLDIINLSGEEYRIKGAQFAYEGVYFSRVRNEAAVNAGLSTVQVDNLSPDAWYELNANYFGEENFNDPATLHRMFDIGLVCKWEDSPKMNALIAKHIQYNSKVSLNENVYGVRNFNNGENQVRLVNLVSGGDNEAIVKEWFPETIKEDGLQSPIALSWNPMLGNVCNGAYADVGFILILEKVEKSLATYKVDFDSKGGTQVASIEGVAAGDKITEPNKPTRQGYIFKGWTLTDGSSEYWDFDNNTVNSNLTLYAIWEKDNSTGGGGGGGTGGGNGGTGGGNGGTTPVKNPSTSDNTSAGVYLVLMTIAVLSTAALMRGYRHKALKK